MSEEIETKKTGWFSKIKAGLKKTSKAVSENISNLVSKKRLDAETLDALEETLVMADLGVETAARLVDELRKSKFNEEVSAEEIKLFFAEKIAALLIPYTKDLATLELEQKPTVITIIGVNGGGKTTTIGKLSSRFKEQGLKVRVAAADTFRAAAVEQLEVWTTRAQVPLFKGVPQADPASVAFDALAHAQKEQDDLLLIDTAGRLHNKDNLMKELEKITRVLKKINPSAPHEVLLVLDATTGQNAHMQVEVFKEVAHVTGIVMTKLDSTSKGGVLVSLVQKHQLPVYAIGVGEGIDDLRSFDAMDFAKGLFDL